ncbi:MMPL family transporter [Candidatus Methanomassiliicoccus intestinalis]|uniref:MMPL family transporter n=1 Tax=Candidatus Methanomassiliicoccus intestinalis TaxID=1406512 RepID=UPI0037DD02BE
MIEKLASFITKRYKWIIAIWIVALIIAVPFVPKLSQVLVYDETQMAPPDVESMSAQEFIDEHFGNAESVPGTIIVLEYDKGITNMEYPDSLNLIYEVQQQLYNKYGTEVTVASVFTPLQELLLVMNGVYTSIPDPSPNEPLPPEQKTAIALQTLIDLGVLPADLTAAEKAQISSMIAQAGSLGKDPSQSAVLALNKEITKQIGGIDNIKTMSPALDNALSLLISENGKITMVTVAYGETGSSSEEQISELRTIVNDAAEGTTVQHWITGSDPLGSELEESTMSDLRIIEPVTIILVLVLIGLFFRSLLGAVMPPLSVGIALGISFSLVYLLSFVMQIHYSVQTLMLTGMMGAGCDYCIFILSRYREERKAGRDKESSVRESVMWAGESIATSGATVIIGFGALAIANFAMLQSMGIALALGVLIALLVALTLIPSLLMLLGDKLFWPAKFGKATDPETFKKKSLKKKDKEGYFTRSAKFSIKHAKVLVVAMILISVPAIYLVTEMDQSYDFVGAMAETESTEGLAVLGEGFGAGVIQPTQIAISFENEIVSEESGINYEELKDASTLAAYLNDLDGVASVTNIDSQLENGTINSILSNDGKSLLLTVVFQDDPYDQQSMAALNDMRDIDPQDERWDSINAIYVGGATALMYDISQLVQNDMNTVEIVVVVAIYLVLLFVLGAVISPLRSIITILLSISWTLAVMVLVFQYALGQDILWIVPMVLLVVCLGLGMDYDILLTTRIREEIAKGKTNNDAIVYSVEKTGGIITACGFIMAAAFGSMMLSSGYLLKEFGFALMFAILLDAMFVRIYLVPAIMSLLGKWNWWAPGPIAKMYKKRNARRLKNAQTSQEHLSAWQRKPED